MQNEYPPQQVNRFTRFLWWCAGADPYFLLRSPVQDRVKYAGIGGIVFSTGVLATFAGGFAFNTAFGPKGLAGDDMSTIGWTIASAVFGICWGALIFNLDRFIVSSTGKGDGTDSITLKEFGQALPRLIIALILGITISKPLELKIIETEINVELRKKQQEKMDEFNKNTDAKYKQEIALIDADIKKVEDDRGVLVQRQKEAEQEYIDQMQGRAGNAGYGPRAKQLEVLKNEKQKEVEDYDVKHASEVTALKARREEKLSAWENDRNNVNKKQAENLDGLLERISIAHDIGYWLGIALMFIFLSIEMGPIFFKMMMNKGPYDYMVENHNYRMYVQNGIVKEEMIFEGRDGMKLMEKINYLEVENDRKEKVEKLRAQEELNKKIIGVWSQQKMKDIDTDASRFYREDTGGGSNA
jgi:hypothetical protein